MTRFREPPVRYPLSMLASLEAGRRGWTAGRLARNAGISRGTAQRILAGRDVMLSSALKVTEALGLDAGRLGVAADLNRPAPLAGMPGLPAAEPAGPPLRCYECTACDRPVSLICNDPEGICHPGECDLEPA